MRLQVLIALICCVGFSFPTLAQPQNEGQSQPALGFRPQPDSQPDIHNMDPLDQLTTQLEGDRLVMSLTGFGFADHYFNSVIPVVASFTEVSWSVLEGYNRKWNTGINLIAIPRTEFESFFGTGIGCIYSLESERIDERLTHAIFMLSGAPEEGTQMRGVLGMTDDENLQALATAGIAMNCDEI